MRPAACRPLATAALATAATAAAFAFAFAALPLALAVLVILTSPAARLLAFAPGASAPLWKHRPVGLRVL